MPKRFTSKIKTASTTPTWRSPPPRSPTAANKPRLPLISLTLLLAALFGLMPEARAALLRHNMLVDDSPESMQTGRVCFALKTLRNGRLLCLPEPYLLEDNGRLQLDLGVKANEQGYKIASRVLDNDVDKDFVDSLFSQQNFQAISGLATLRAIYSGTSLSYTPLHVMGAFKLSNPSLPEIHVAGMRESVLRVGQNILIRNWGGIDYGELLLSPSVFYYQRQFAYLDVDWLSSAGSKFDSLIEKKSRNGVDGDLAVTLLSRHAYLPTVSVRAENIANSGACPTCAQRFFDIERYFGTMTEVDMSFSVSHPIGQSLLGFEAPFFGAFQQFDILKTTATYAYKLSKLECFMSFSPMIYTFGFLFDSNVYRLGILYSDEKQDNSIQIARQKQTYVFTSFYL